MALVVVGGIALVKSMGSKSDKPSAQASSSGVPETTPQSQQADRKVFASMRVTGKSSEVLARDSITGKIYIQAELFTDELRDIFWPEVDLTIYDASAVQVTVGGQPFKLPAKQGKVTLRFTGGKLTETS